VRRRLREIVRQAAAGCLRPGHDYVLIGRRAALELPFDRMVEQFDGALRRLQPRRPEPDTGSGRGPRRNATTE